MVAHLVAFFESFHFGLQGIGILLDGIWGTGNGSTTYAENIGAIGITGVGSRRVVQVGACFMILFGIIGEYFGVFCSTLRLVL